MAPNSHLYRPSSAEYCLAMSHKNLEIVKQFIDAFNQRQVEVFAGITTPDFEWTTSVMAIEGEIFRGREGIDTYFERMIETWDEFRGIAHEVRDLGDRVLWLGRLEGRGRSSGVPIKTPLDVLFDFRDEKIWRMRSFLDHGEAMRAAGLSE
jgi:ketosteroid isomerase-like protein